LCKSPLAKTDTLPLSLKEAGIKNCKIIFPDNKNTIGEP